MHERDHVDYQCGLIDSTINTFKARFDALSSTACSRSQATTELEAAAQALVAEVEVACAKAVEAGREAGEQRAYAIESDCIYYMKGSHCFYLNNACPDCP